jgi:CHASE3 domain sensor protein
MTGSSIDSTQFRRILSRNVAMPLGISVLSALVFVGIIAYLINVLSWVEHSERVIGAPTKSAKLSSDMEAGMRGYLLSGDDETSWSLFRVAKPKVDAELNAWRRMVDDNFAQPGPRPAVRSAQREWQLYAEEAIARRAKERRRGDRLVKSGRGKMLTDEVRRQFRLFIETEERLLQERNSSSRSVIAWSVGAFLLFSLTVAACWPCSAGAS